MIAPDLHAPPIAFLATSRTMSVRHTRLVVARPRCGTWRGGILRSRLVSPWAASAGVGGLTPAGRPAWIPRLMFR
jgi:hypothetical protein